MNISEYERLKPKKTYKALKAFLAEKERQLDFVKLNNENLSSDFSQFVMTDIERIKDILDKFSKGE